MPSHTFPVTAGRTAPVSGAVHPRGPLAAHPPAGQTGPARAESPRPAGPRYQFIVATADPDVRSGLKGLLGGHNCEVLTAGSGVDCLGLLRGYRPDLLVIVPPLLWGSEEGVLEVLRADPGFHGITALVVTNAGDPRLPPVAFHFYPGPARHPDPLERLVHRVCHWLWCYRPPGPRPGGERSGV